MKKAALTILLLIFCESVFAQANSLVIYNSNGLDSFSIHSGDLVKVKLKNGRKLKGDISNIGFDRFQIGNDTIGLSDVASLRFRPQFPTHVGQVLMITGCTMVVTGTILTVRGLLSEKRNSMDVFGAGVLLITGGVIFLGVGELVNVHEKSIHKKTGGRWNLKIG